MGYFMLFMQKVMSSVKFTHRVIIEQHSLQIYAISMFPVKMKSHLFCGFTPASEGVKDDM